MLVDSMALVTNIASLCRNLIEKIGLKRLLKKNINKIRYMSSLAISGFDNRSPLFTNSITASVVSIFAYGIWPNDNISYSKIPNDQLQNIDKHNNNQTLTHRFVQNIDVLLSLQLTSILSVIICHFYLNN
jgi:hypothetical protein